MPKEESGGKFPLLLDHSVDDNKKEIGKRKGRKREEKKKEKKK